MLKNSAALNISSPALATLVTLSLLAMAGCGTAKTPVTPSKSDPTGRLELSESYGKLPLHFEANRGQTGERVKFLARGRRATLFLTPSEAVLAFRTPEQPGKDDPRATRVRAGKRGHATRTVIRMTFVGAHPEPRLAGMDELSGKANYFIGNEPAKWRTNLPTYARVKYHDVYPGIDLIWYGNQRQLEYDFVVRPGADPQRILLSFQGADRVEVDAQGDLVLHTAAGTIRQQKPAIYQEVDGARREIDGGYVPRGGHRMGFRVATYDAHRPLIIDPVLFYSTYLGSSGDDERGFGIAVDASGNAYVTGATGSTDFPTTSGAFQNTFGGSATDVFVTKLNPTGSGLIYSTYLGGNGEDWGLGIALDIMGNAYVTGYTDSTNFPTTAVAFQPTFGGGVDPFVTKLNATGSGLVYSTYLGGSEVSRGRAIAVDAAGSAYVTGEAGSTFPTTPGAFQTTFSGVTDAFVTKLDPTGSALAYSTYLGGGGAEEGFGIAVDATGNAYVTGGTQSAAFPTTPGAFQTTFGGVADAFVTKLNPTGTVLVYCTYLGGSENDTGLAIAVDGAGSAYVTGYTDSTAFPTTAGAFQTTHGGVTDAFVTKLDPAGSGLSYSTYVGGTDFDQGLGIAVDAVGNTYLTGDTLSADFPTTPGAFQASHGSAGISQTDGYVVKLNPAGSGLIYSSFLGGNDQDDGNAIAIDALPNPNAYITGETQSTNFPTTPGAFQPTLGGANDGFVAQISEAGVQPGPFTARVTGGGTIDVVGGMSNFHLIVQERTDGTFSGQVQYFNHATGAKTRSETITSLMIVGNMATFDGTCTVNGVPCTFTAHVSDNGEPGSTDTFTISVTPGPTEGGTLRSGNILITQ